MSNQLPAVQEARNEVAYKPFGGEDTIKLNLNIIRNYIAVPAIDKNTKAVLLPDERECMKFMMLCRSRRLNPFEGDGYMIPFWNGQTGRHEWSLITAENHYLKRAETHPDYAGYESGVIISPPIECKPCRGTGFNEHEGRVIPCPQCKASGKIDELEGDFVPDKIDEIEIRLVGGWCRVHYNNPGKKPVYRRVKLSTFMQNFGRWLKDPAGMIVKVAEADALRSAFPNLLGGLYMKEEMAVYNVAAEVVSTEAPAADAPRPKLDRTFAKGLGPVNLEPGAKPASVQKQDNAKEVAPRKPAKTAQDAPGKSDPAETPATPESSQAQTASGVNAPLAEVVEFPVGAGEQGEPEPSDNDGDLGPQTPEPEPEQEQTYAPDPEMASKNADSEACKSVKLLANKAGVSWNQLRAWLLKKGLAKEGQKLNDLSEAKLVNLGQSFHKHLPDMRQYPR